MLPQNKKNTFVIGYMVFKLQHQLTCLALNIEILTVVEHEPTTSRLTVRAIDQSD